MSVRGLPPLTDAERGQFIAAARAYLGVRWHHQGRSKRGVDCAGLLIAAMRDIGKEPTDVVGYGKQPYRGRLEEVLRANCGDPLPYSALQPGDVALMKFDGAPSHVGIVTAHPVGGLAFLHAYARNKHVVEHRLDAEWLNRIVEVYRP